ARAWSVRCARCCRRYRCSRWAGSRRTTCPPGAPPDARAPASAASSTAPASRLRAPASRRGASATPGWVPAHDARRTGHPAGGGLSAAGFRMLECALAGAAPRRPRVPGARPAGACTGPGRRGSRCRGRHRGAAWSGTGTSTAGGWRARAAVRGAAARVQSRADGEAIGGAMGAVNVATAELAVDSRCRLGEGIVWDARLGCLYWTDILSARLWMHVPATGQTHHWDLPEPLGCLALCEDGRLLLALAKSIRLAAAPVPGASLA